MDNLLILALVTAIFYLIILLYLYIFNFNYSKIFFILSLIMLGVHIATSVLFHIKYKNIKYTLLFSFLVPVLYIIVLLIYDGILNHKLINQS